MASRITKPKRSTRINSRSGCMSCKKKRLKCDETIPACMNCLKRDIECPGYQQIFKWPSKCQTNTKDFSVKTKKRTRPKRSQDSYENEIQPRHILYDKLHITTSDLEILQKDRSRENGEIIDGFSNGELDPNTFSEDWVNQNNAETADNMTEVLHSNDEVNMPTFDWNLLANEEPYTQSVLQSTPRDLDTISFNSVQTSLDNFSMPQSFDWLTVEQIAAEQALSKRRGGVKRMLKGFYGMKTSVSLPLVHQETKLVEYYFSNISGIYSCFDSHLNPFRSFVGQMWTLSPSMYYTIQSMAAAHLANGMHPMRKLGIDLHRKASQHLSQELSTCYSQNPRNEQILLVLLLIGLTASWHRPGDLGLPYLRIARSLMHLHPSFNQANELESAGALQNLFEEAMIYWEMMISFVANESDVDIILLDQHQDNQLPQRPEEMLDMAPIMESFTESSETLPHPWTGISPQSQMLLAHVGRLVRRVRLVGTKDSLKAAEEQYLPIAQELEESLLATLPISGPLSVESGDQFTKTDDFLTLAETTRDCGLLELYRTFPKLLQRRLVTTKTVESLPIADTDNVEAAGCYDPGLPPRSDAARQQQHKTWLTSLALHILKCLESIPDSSNIRCHQLLLLLIAAAELRLPPHNSGSGRSMYDLCDLDLEITRARGFARARLNQLAVRLPAQPVRVMLDLLDEVWTRMDCDNTERTDDIFWVDVMIEKGLHTVMG